MDDNRNRRRDHFNPWSYKCEVMIGPIEPQNELRCTPREFIKYIDRVRQNKSRRTQNTETGNMLIHNTRFNYHDGQNHIGLACGEYTDPHVLQNLKRFILQPDVGFVVANGCGGIGLSEPVTPNDGDADDDGVEGSSSTAAVKENEEEDEEEKEEQEKEEQEKRRGVHSDLYRRQIPRESLTRLLDMPIFHGTNVKNIVQSGKSYLYYLLTYLLANCMRMYVLPGPQLPCFSAIVPLHALCTIFDFNINALPARCIQPIEQTKYAYLATSLRVKYMFVFPPNVSFFDRRDPVIHDGSIDTCDKLFLTDDEYSDFRINCTLNCKNRNEDFDGDTNNPSMCKGIESHTEIKYNMRTHLMPLLRNRHIFSQNILYRLFVILALDPPYEQSFNRIRRNGNLPVERDLYENVVRVLQSVDIVRNKHARRRALGFFGEFNFPLYELYLRPNLLNIHGVIRDFEQTRKSETLDSGALNELYVETLHKLDTVWRTSTKSSAGNCFSLPDNMIRSMALIQGDRCTTEFVDGLLRDVHDRYPHVFTGEEPLCFTTIANVLSTAKGNFDDILLLQRNFEMRLEQVNDLGVSRALMDLLMPVQKEKLQQNKQYLDNFVYGSKKVPKNSKLAVSTKWTLQNVIYYEGDLYIDGRVVLGDCFQVFSYELFMDIDAVCAVLDAVLLDNPLL